MSLTSVGKLLNKVVRIQNGRENAEYINFLQLSVLNNAFHMLLELHFVVFYHNIIRIHISKQKSKPRNSSDYKKNSKTANYPLPILHLNWSISLRTVDFTEF